MRKIAIDIREFENGRMTGIGRYLKNFIINASRICTELEFILLGNHKTEIPFSLPDNSKFIRIYELLPQIWEQICLPLALSKEKPDVFLSPYYKRPLFTTIPCVITIHDIIPLIFPASMFEKYILKKLMKIYIKRSIVLTDSEHSAKDIKLFFPNAVTRLKVVYNAVDFSYKKQNLLYSERKHLGIKEKYLLYVGNSRPHKNLGVLCSAYLSLPQKIKDEYQLVMAGIGYKDGPWNNIEGIVKIPVVDDNLLAKLYSSATLFIFPSLYEGFGLPPLEAMYFGCPVLSSSASCMPEILGSAAEYFDPYNPQELRDKICNLLKNTERFWELTSLGIARAGKYTVEKFSKKILEALMEATG